MNDEQRLAICEVCTNKEFSPKLGVVCALTSQRPAFEGVCNDFKSDPKMIARKHRAAESRRNLSEGVGGSDVIVEGGSSSPWRIILSIVLFIIVLVRILSRCDRMMD